MAEQPQSRFPDPPETIGELLALLARPFRPDVIQQRKIGGRQVSYVPVDAVIDRLNRACQAWSYRIVGTTWEKMWLNRWDESARKNIPTEVFVYVVTGELEIPGLGARQAQGVQAIDPGSGEDLLKGASSDALKKCATLFGVPVDGQ